MRFRCSIVLVVLTLLTSSAGPSKRQACRRGSVRYSVATYKDEIFFKARYQHLFDSLLQAATYQCFCQTTIRNLPKSLGDGSRWRIKPSMAVIVEPLVDLSTMDGVYARRTYRLRRGRRNPRFRCGYEHLLFLIADRRYYALSRDTLANRALMAKVFQGRFAPAEVTRMQQHYPYGDICDHNTFLAPDLVRRGPKVLFDLHWLADSSRADK